MDCCPLGGRYFQERCCVLVNCSVVTIAKAGGVGGGVGANVSAFIERTKNTVQV